MTVRELCKTVNASRYTIANQGNAIPFDPENELEMEAYGGFIVGRATTYNSPEETDVGTQAELEITIKRDYAGRASRGQEIRREPRRGTGRHYHP